MFPHSIDYWTVTLGGIPILGFAESDALGFKKTQDDSEIVQCCDGGAVLNEHPGRVWEVTCSLRYGSTADRALQALANSRAISSFSAVGRNGESFRSPGMRVKTQPERKFGAKAADVEWVLHGEGDYMPSPGGV